MPRLMGPIQAIQASWRLVIGHEDHLLLLGLVILLLGGIGLVAYRAKHNRREP